MKPDESSPVAPAPLTASHRVSLSPNVSEQLPNWEELFSAHNVARMGQLADNPCLPRHRVFPLARRTAIFRNG